MTTRLICSNFLVLSSLFSALIFTSTGLAVTSEPDLRIELGEMVAIFNGHAKSLDINVVESVRAFNGFIDQVISSRWDTEYMAIHLLTEAKYNSLSAGEQVQVRESLETTFHRYVYEIIQEYKKVPLALVGGVFQGKKGNLRIKIRGKPRVFPALTGELYLSKSEGGWAIIDVGYANFSYISLKRRAYQRKLRRAGVDGLTDWLDKKNRRFFADYCGPELGLIMPARISDLCEAE